MIAQISFEIEQEDGFRQYGPSKEHRPNPIVEMGLFLDGDGIPLAFCIHSGNTNEQVTLVAAGRKILHDFSLPVRCLYRQWIVVSI